MMLKKVHHMLGAHRTSVAGRGYSIYVDDSVTVLINLSEVEQNIINTVCFCAQRYCSKNLVPHEGKCSIMEHNYG